MGGGTARGAWRRCRGLWISWVLALALVAPAFGGESSPEEIVEQALRQAGSIPAQAEALARLAWPAEEKDPALAAFARDKLGGFGMHGMKAIRRAIQWVKPEQQASVVATLLQAFRWVTADIPPDYLPALEEAVWFGTREARRLAIPELARLGYQSALLTLMDAGLEDPELLPLVIEALEQLRDDRARFFLERVMRENLGGQRQAAADALGRIGERARVPLKAALRAEDPALRIAAARALVAVASVDDLPALFEYVYRYPDEDPELVRAVRERAEALERQAVGQASEGSGS